MTKLITMLSVTSFFACINANAQTGINTTTPDASAALEIKSPANNKGLLIPRMTTVQKNAIPSPATGLMVYDTTTNSVSQNTGTPAAPNWINTSDNLGNHTATTALNMANNNITGAANIATQTATIAKGTDGKVPAAGDLVSAADANGNLTFIKAADFGNIIYNSGLVGPGNTWTFLLTTDPVYSNFIIAASDGCTIPMIANFVSWNNAINFIGGGVPAGDYVKTSLDLYGTSFKLTVTATTCTGEGDSTAFNISLKKETGKITVTNNGNASKRYTLRQRTN